jgi:putative acetyltransferase
MIHRVHVPVRVRPTATEDRPQVLDLVRSAFSDESRDGHEEVDIVMNTWTLGEAVRPIDLVAVGNDAVVGHVLGARGRLGERDVIGIAPLAVVPSHQGRGIGTTLMEEFLARADDEQWPMAVLLGSPAYYARFGFEPSAPLGITYPPVGEGSPHFQVRRLTSYDTSWRGTFTYCWEL